MPRRFDNVGATLKTQINWILGGGIIITLVGYSGWLILMDAPAYQFLVRLYGDKRFLKHTLRDMGVFAPIIFIALQALQVVIAPIPGGVTGLLGGYLFGQWVGVLYSTIGLTLGSITPSASTMNPNRFQIPGLTSCSTTRAPSHRAMPNCFVIFLIPGLPKDMACYLFGLSPMPFWVFAVVSTLGRIPDTWILSAEGAHTAAGDYLELILLTALVVAVAPPLYHYRNGIIGWFAGNTVRSPRRGRSG